MKTQPLKIKSLHSTLEGLKNSAESQIVNIRIGIGNVMVGKSNTEKMLWNRINHLNQLLSVTTSCLEDGDFEEGVEWVRCELAKLLQDHSYAGNENVYPYKID